MSLRAPLLATASIVVIAAAGCGGGGDSSTDTTAVTTTGSTTLTKEEFIQQGDGICAEVNAAIGTIESSSADSTAKLSQEADLYSGMMDRLEGLGTPDDSAGLDSVLSAGDDLVQAQQDAQLAAERGDSTGLTSAESDAAAALGSFQDAASSFGFEECGQGPSAPQTTGTAPTTTTPAAPTTPATTTPAPTTPAAPVTPAPAPAPAPATGGGTSGGTSGGATGGGGTSGGATGGGGSSGGVGPG